MLGLLIKQLLFHPQFNFLAQGVHCHASLRGSIFGGVSLHVALLLWRRLLRPCEHSNERLLQNFCTWWEFCQGPAGVTIPKHNGSALHTLLQILLSPR